jgi:uracil-DNA glycosylase
MPDEREGLAWNIAHCPYFEDFDKGGAGPCWKIIASQELEPRNRYPPESWTGRIAEAQILFVTSNPNTTPGKPPKPMPTTPMELLKFNEEYFEEHSLGRVPTWRRLPLWASQLLGTEPDIAQRCLAITDVVRCASKIQSGVPEALNQCVVTWLPKVIAESHAAVIAWCGSYAQAALREHLPHRIALSPGESWGPREFYGRERILLGLPHPAYRFKDCDHLDDLFDRADLERAAAWLASNAGNKPGQFSGSVNRE